MKELRRRKANWVLQVAVCIWATEYCNSVLEYQSGDQSGSGEQEEEEGRGGLHGPMGIGLHNSTSTY